MKLGLLGERLAHTLSPSIHKKIFERLNVKGDYGAYEKTPDELEVFILSLERQGFTGINITIPYKTSAMKYMDRLSKEAEKIGAINTVHVKNGKLTGYNTDYYGFAHALKKAVISPASKKACILGSGGSAKAVAEYLKDSGADRITIISRKPAKKSAGFKGCDIKSYCDIKGDILINTTPIGMYPDTGGCPVEKSVLTGFEAIIDIVYNPRETVLLRYAKELGIKNAGGIVMLTAQAVKSQEIWRQRAIGDDVIDEIAVEL